MRTQLSGNVSIATDLENAIALVRRAGMDMTGWVEYFTIGLSTQLVEVKQRGELVIHQDVLSRRHSLTDRQSRAIGYMLEHGRMTITDFETLFPETSRRTLQRDLSLLVDKGLVIREGQTSRLEYVLADGF